MTSKHKSEDYKISAVEYYLVGDDSQLEVCRIFKCSPRSLMRWLDKYNNDEGEIKRYNRKPIAYKVHKEYVKFLLDEIKKNKTITMTELKNKLKDKFNIEISRFHINRIVNDNNITLKITRIRHEPTKRFGKDVDINEKLKEFYDEIRKHKLEDIICIDETSISGLQKRSHCYSELGKRCVIKTQSQEVFKKYTGIFAISYNGVLCWELYDKGGIDSDRLYEFLEKYITKKYKNKLIILDNASSHRNAKIKDLVNKHNILLYSVVYQHFTNSIENYFSMMKSNLYKLDGLTHKELKENIGKVVKEIPKEKYENIIKGTYNRSEKYIKKPSNRRKILKNYL
jgi:transposase